MSRFTSPGCKSRLLFAKIAMAIWFQVSGGVIKIAHNMALKNIPYLFLPVCLVSGSSASVHHS
jgi:hypothetical protein